MVVGRQGRDRASQRGRSQREGIGIILQPKRQLTVTGLASALSPLCLRSSHPVACATTSLPYISTWGRTFILHAQSSHMALSPAPLPRQNYLLLFCPLRHMFILTQYNWGMPVGQYSYNSSGHTPEFTIYLLVDF